MGAVEVATGFNECINRRDLTGLAALMTEDHAFTSTTGATVRGKAAYEGPTSVRADLDLE
jgi:ketosteroid isomerase-like protein